MVWCITADYRPKNTNKPKYYVIADSKKEAKEKFMAKISWLKIYSCELLNKTLGQEIVSRPEKYIIIGG